LPGMEWVQRGTLATTVTEEPVSHGYVNTRTSLWPERWPAIALQECIDIVEAAPADQQHEVKFTLPCQTCTENTRCLNAKRKELGPLLYDREILTLPRSSESTLFPMDLWRPNLRARETLVPYWHKPFSVEHEFGVCQAWDIAWSEKVGGDWLVCETAYVHRPTGKRHLLDIQRWQRLSFREQIALMGSKAKQFRPDLVVIETDAAQQVWRQEAERDLSVPVMGHDSDLKTDLAMGVPGLLIMLEARKWEIPYQPGTLHHEEVRNLLAEFEAYGWQDGKLGGVGEHDDTVATFWHLNWGRGRGDPVREPGRRHREDAYRGGAVVRHVAHDGDAGRRDGHRRAR
jgi:hypothetical protein